MQLILCIHLLFKNKTTPRGGSFCFCCGSRICTDDLPDYVSGRDTTWYISPSDNGINVLREPDLHRRSPGYGPGEILLLHPAIYVSRTTLLFCFFRCLSNFIASVLFENFFSNTTTQGMPFFVHLLPLALCFARRDSKSVVYPM